MATGTSHNSSHLAAILLFLILPLLVVCSSTIPAPIIVSPSQYWEGNDGPWSTFTVQVGTPAQDVRVLISTAGTETWVVLPEGCGTDAPPNCGTLRGQEFNISDSSTWIANNFYALELESNLGYTGNGEFGFDTVGLSWQGSGGPSLEHQVVAGIAAPDFWLGNFGLTPRPTNFSNFNDPQPSFMQTLQNKSMIPSLSWSYNAGAPYRLQKVLGSLILGGYDLSKAGPTNMSFTFAEDISRDLTVGLQAVSASFLGTSHSLLPQGILTFIDSTVPTIWLPLAACQQFEKVFGLTWDETTELYLVNDTLHTTLLNNNATFTFSLGNSVTGGPVLNITLPYASFDLSVSWPIVANTTRYFPIQRAANDTQYTLGRTFLQEAYLTVDYERSTFYVSQCAFQGGATQHIIPILSTNSSTNSTSPNPTSSPASSGSSHSFPIGAIVGIAIGGILLGVVLVLALLFFKKIGPFAKKPEEVSKPPEEPPIEMVDYQFAGKPELDSSPAPVSQKHASEIGGMPVEYYAPEKEGTSAGELEAGPSMIFEMMGDTTRAQELQDTASSPNSPRSPYADRRSHMSGTVSPVSDRGEDSRARRESNLSNGPSP